MALKDISQYYENNGLILNLNKTDLISFSLKESYKSLLVGINNKTVAQSSVIKYLEVFID